MKIQEKELQHFLDTASEKILLFRRTHWVFLIPPILLTFLAAICTAYITLFVSSYIHIFLIVIPLLLGIAAFSLTAIAKIIIDWYFHIYLVTTHKLVEIFYSPFFLYKTNTVLLSQVRCTEIDESKQGILEESFDFGNVTFTFDRPTHSEEFTMYHIASPEKIVESLRNFLLSPETVQQSMPQFQYPSPAFFGRRVRYA